MRGKRTGNKVGQMADSGYQAVVPGCIEYHRSGADRFNQFGGQREGTCVGSFKRREHPGRVPVQSDVALS